MPYIMIILMLCAFAGIDWFIADRLRQGLSFLFPGVKLWYLIGVMASITLLLMVGFMRSLLPLPTGVKRALGTMSSYMMGAFVYLLIFMVLAEIAVLVCAWAKLVVLPSAGARFIAGTAALVLTLATVCGGVIQANRLQHVSYDIEISGKTAEPMNIVLISDLHLGAVGSEARLENIVEGINRLEPDLVLVAGDFFDNDYSAIRDPEKAEETLRKLNSRYGIYVSLGNHDSGATLAEMESFLERCGIVALKNKYTVVDDRIVLVGRLDASPIGGYGGESRAELADVLEGADTSLPVIVMDHNPTHVDSYNNMPEIDLVVCGHTHRGQIFPGSMFTRMMFTADYGYYRYNEHSAHVVVTSGVGTWGMPMRVGTDSEIVSIRLG